MTPPGSGQAGAGWLGRVRARLARWRVGPGVVVAVSGGSDSVALLRVLHELGPGLGLRLVVAHLDHGVRGEGAAADARFVAGLAESLGLPCEVGRWCPERPSHFEADARRARYDWLAGVARARDCAAVAVGHTRDDQAETALHRVIRGTGVRGLAGMPARRALDGDVVLIRPFLDVSRAELRDFLAAIGQDFREDPSNADRSRTRARIRHDLLPKLEAEYNPRAVEALARLGGLAGAADRALRIRLRELERALAFASSPDEIILDRPALSRLPSSLRTEFLRRLWRRAGWPEGGMTAGRWRRLSALARRPSARASVGGGVEASNSPERMRLSRNTSTGGPDRPWGDPVPLPVPGAVDWPGGQIVATLGPVDAQDETIDYDRLACPLSVRAPAPGDRFEPLGMGGRTTPLNDFFRGRRVPRGGRAGVPLVCDREGIVWVVGHRIAHRVRRTESTTRTLGLRWEPR